MWHVLKRNEVPESGQSWRGISRCSDPISVYTFVGVENDRLEAGRIVLTSALFVVVGISTSVVCFNYVAIGYLVRPVVRGVSFLIAVLGFPCCIKVVLDGLKVRKHYTGANLELNVVIESTT